MISNTRNYNSSRRFSSTACKFVKIIPPAHPRTIHMRSTLFSCAASVKSRRPTQTDCLASVRRREYSHVWTSSIRPTSEMDTLYTSRLHGFPGNLSKSILEPNLTEESILSLLVVLGSSISLVALVFAFITYSLFSDLRNLSGTTLMNLLAALFMSQLLYVVGVGGVPDSELCISLAFALQYARLSTFCWMLLMTHNMHNQFKTGLHLVPVMDHHITSNFVRYSLFGWGSPLILLGGSVLIQYHDKAGKLLDTASMKAQNCWFLEKNAFIYGLLAPSCIMIASTFYYLVCSGLLASYIISMQADIRTREKMKKKRALQILLFSKLTIVLSIVLALSAITKLSNRWEPIWVAYHVAQGLQGIFVAMLVTCNCQVLKMYTRSIKSRASKHVPSYVSRGQRSRSASKSTSLQLLTWEPMPDSV